MPEQVTTRAGLRYPQNIDPATTWLYWQHLAEDVDAVITLYSQADPRPAFGIAGRMHRHPTTGVWSLDTGTAWVDIGTGGPFLALAGGTMTGGLDHNGQEVRRGRYRDARATISIVVAAGATRTLDMAVANDHDITLDQNVTLSFTGAPTSGEEGWITAIIRQPTPVKAITWPGSVDWIGRVAPVHLASSVNVHTFLTRDAGATWLEVGRALDIG